MAIVDDAVELVHADLWPNVAQAASFSYRQGNRGSAWPLPCSGADGHGTSVAGIIAARDDNAIGVAGVAPRASIVAYNALATSTDADIADALTRDLAANGVYNNSWGSPDTGVLNAAEPSFVAAIQAGIANGRGGKGAIYVFPGGNGGPSDNANFDGYVNKLGVIAVCAVDDTGRAPYYAEPGANLLVCAPSSNNRVVGGQLVGITTTRIGNGYRSDFSGTSASTPTVAGVAALVLAANPQLTWRDLRLILAQTARQNDPNDPGWTSHFGYRFNHKYGFGVVDAAAAVALAPGWQSVGGSENLKSCGPYTRSALNLALPDATGPAASPVVTPVSDSQTIAGCDITAIEFVEIRFTATHAYSGDLRVRLSSPAGLQSVLAAERGCLPANVQDPCRPYNDWQFGSNRHLGEAVNGTWTLEVTDMQPLDTGRFDRWSIRFHGR
ncbi:MAG TPA: S8 family serine peptidase [Burkholderiaceae bacterium]|nr:S8 family serine peptidase [Burkholderiaceae bacterium]